MYFSMSKQLLHVRTRMTGMTSSARASVAKTVRFALLGTFAVFIVASQFSSGSSRTRSALASTPFLDLTSHNRHLLDTTEPDLWESNSTSCMQNSTVDCSLVHHYTNYCSNKTFQPFTSQCQFVTEQCINSSAVLVNYIGFVYCTMERTQPIAYLVLVAWLLLLVSLLATTADNFFVPPLTLISDKMKLSPAVAGITLLALGNGAPDVFTAYAALNSASDIALELGALLGASMFIATVVLGSVILLSNVRDCIKPSNFYRDCITYIVVVSAVIGISCDGVVTLYESTSLLGIYLIYIGIVVFLTRSHFDEESRSGSFTSIHAANGNEKQPLLAVNDDDEEEEKVDPYVLDSYFAGVSWPHDVSIVLKFQYLIELPFSVLRWLSIPCGDAVWGPKHRWLAIGSPVFLAMLLLLSAEEWDGFTMKVGGLPVMVLVLIVSLPISVLLYLTSSPDPSSPPSYFTMLCLGAFVSSIAWLMIQANETVAVLEAFGIAVGIDTAILGLTVLAIGNSIGDWIADTAVARAGRPAMGVASCFGSPLLNDVLGLGVSLTSYCVKGYLHNGPKSYDFDINSTNFNKVKMSWVFLLHILLAHLIVFPVFSFSPPKEYGIFLIAYYIVFMLCSVLDEAGYIQ